jgi:predicted metalloprotease with PDZ domain
MGRLRQSLAALALAVVTSTALTSIGAQQTGAFQRISYTLAMTRPTTHLFEVSIAIETPPGPVPAFLDLQMPLWQPGRYSNADFAKNVQEFSARAGSQALTFEKVDSQTWRVETRGNRAFSVAYKVFGNDLSGTYAQLDGTHGNFNGGEIFMYVAGHKQDAVELRIQPPSGWRAINGDSETPNQTHWKYSNYELLIDSPTEVGPDWTLDEFSTGGKNYRVVVHSRGNEGGLRPNLVRDLRRIVDTEVAMWGTPEFDRYTFMYHFANDNRSFDGMEHLSSTQIINGGNLADPGVMARALEDAAHEFFHVWNVKRLRPAALGPWDWTRPANTKSLWIAEGLTQYYGNLMMRRAGLWNDARYLSELNGSLDYVENSPGTRLMSAVDASLAAPFIDSAVHRQQTNLANTSITYYVKGELIGTVMDLTIRGRTKGSRSLDDVFRLMYDEFYVKAPNASYYLKGRGYTEEDFVRALSRVAGTDMQGFYDRYIRGVEVLPYDDAFAVVGLRLVKTADDRMSSGIVIDRTGAGLRLGALPTDGPAARSGLQQGDQVVAIGGSLVNRTNWQAVLERFNPGDRVKVQVERFDRTVDVELVLGEPASFTYRLEDLRDVSDEARRLRAGWLSGK